MTRDVALKDVARRAGVSAATASNALSGARYVAEGTRQRVAAAAAELQYRPNLVARGLRRNETLTVGLLVSDISNPYYPAVARAIQDRLADEGYVAFIGNTDGRAETETRFLEEMRSRNVDGVIMSPMGLDGPSIRTALGPNIPLVLLTGEVVDEKEATGLTFDTVGTDDSLGINAAVSHLVAGGIYDIAFISGPSGSAPGTGRLQAFRDAMNSQGISLDEGSIRFADSYSSEAGLSAGASLFSEASRPAAVMCANDLIAIGVLESARDAGLDVPSDVAVVGFDDIDTAKLVMPRLTTVINPAALVGRACADALLRRIRDPQRPHERHLLPTHLIARQSA